MAEQGNNSEGTNGGREASNLEESLRAEYGAISDYTIHYSNMRSALFVFLMGAAFYVMADQLGKEDNNFSWILYISGFFFAIFSNVFNLELTRMMQLGFNRLAEIECILIGLTQGVKASAEPRLLMIFSQTKAKGIDGFLSSFFMYSERSPFFSA